MKRPTISGLFQKEPDAEQAPPLPSVEVTRRIRRIGATWHHSTGASGQWAVLFEEEREPVLLASWNIEDQGRRLHLNMAKAGDRLRTVHIGDSLVDVENLDL